MHSKVWSGTPGPCPPDARSTPSQLRQLKMSADIVKCPLGANLLLVGSRTLLKAWDTGVNKTDPTTGILLSQSPGPRGRRRTMNAKLESDKRYGRKNTAGHGCWGWGVDWGPGEK